MKHTLIAATLALSACADSKVSNYVCTHQITLTAGANAAIANAVLIRDPVAQKAAINGANTTLALIAACPVGTVQVVDAGVAVPK